MEDNIQQESKPSDEFQPEETLDSEEVKPRALMLLAFVANILAWAVFILSFVELGIRAYLVWHPVTPLGFDFPGNTLSVSDILQNSLNVLLNFAERLATFVFLQVIALGAPLLLDIQEYIHEIATNVAKKD
jgi:hypothetical protein